MRRESAENLEPEWEETAATSLRGFLHLESESTDRILDSARQLDRAWYWEGLEGLVVTPRMRAVVVVPAAVMTSDIGVGFLADVTSILLAPTSSVGMRRRRLGGPIVSEGVACVLGESLLHGPLRIAWDSVIEEAKTDAASSVVIHELAHKIDMADGVVDGTPPIRDRRQSVAFERIATEALARLRAGGPAGPLRSYAATSRAELFAVATEAFFLRPVDLAEGEPGLYGALAGFYRQDPAASRWE